MKCFYGSCFPSHGKRELSRSDWGIKGKQSRTILRLWFCSCFFGRCGHRPLRKV